eukprot:CAMPEP_0176122442 /NCGR_PEP_ID=MMETSP0120_2-20121206/61670_1 /TAXON_ID=160619 /ORGANISM="Kryptoperidinium foliaceum, Strain CCMP 1326" /LENGTH=91 /DNA_ID=CAMNT_0017457073 /DNA_START=234 /DNA_END=506 /DNA_ORIENTATION=-
MILVRLPDFFVPRPRALVFARPLYFGECTPRRLPGSADIVLAFALFRMKALFFFTHCHSRSDGMAIAEEVSATECGPQVASRAGERESRLE